MVAILRKVVCDPNHSSLKVNSQVLKSERQSWATCPEQLAPGVDIADVVVHFSGRLGFRLFTRQESSAHRPEVSRKYTSGDFRDHTL